MKKIPYALTLLVAYIIMTYSRFSTAFGETGNLASMVIVLVPVALAVLLIVNMKKDVSQIAAILCLVLGACNLYQACTLFATMMEMSRAGESAEYAVIALLPALANAAFGGLLSWFVGAHIQDGEITGAYKFLGFLAILAQLFLGFVPLSSGYGNVPVSSLANLVIILIYWHLPHAFVNYATAKKTKVIHIIILVILVVLSVGVQASLLNMA